MCSDRLVSSESVEMRGFTSLFIREMHGSRSVASIQDKSHSVCDTCHHH